VTATPFYQISSDI